MGLPSQVLNFTSPILTQALKTGARSSTSKTTNYGVIGDAFFKKAQLDLGIANLQADIGIRSATLMSGLEMDKARLELDKAGMLMDQEMKMRELAFQEKVYKEQNDVGFFEGLFGTIAGAAQGAMAGHAIDPTGGALIGAVAGGALTGVGYATEGKKGGNAAKEMMGVISEGAQYWKGVKQQKAQREGLAGLMNAGANLLSQMNQPDLTPTQRHGLEQQWQQHQSAIYQFQVSNGVNMQQAAEATAAYGKVMRGYDAADPAQKAQFGMIENVAGLAAVENPTREDLMNFYGRQSSLFAAAHGGKELSEDQISGMFREAHPDKDLMTVFMGKTKTAPRMETVGPAIDPTQRPLAPEQPRVQNFKAEQQPGTAALGNPRQGRRTQQPAPQISAPVDHQGPAGWHAPMVYPTPALSWDEMQPPAAAEQQLAKQGAETAKILQKEEDETRVGFKERFTNFSGKSDEELLSEKKEKVRKEQYEKLTPQQREGLAANNKKRWEQLKEDNLASANERAQSEEEVRQNEIFHKSKNVKEVQNAIGVDPKKIHMKAGDDTSDVITSGSEALVGINRAEEVILDMDKEMQKWSPEKRAAVARAAEIAKYGEGGKEGNLAIEGSSKGAMVKGFGINTQEFKKTYTQQLKGAGLSDKDVEQSYAMLRRLDQITGPLSGRIAKANLGGQLSNTDLAIHAVKGIADTNPLLMLSQLDEARTNIIDRIRSTVTGAEVARKSELQFSRDSTVQSKSIQQSFKDDEDKKGRIWQRISR